MAGDGHRHGDRAGGDHHIFPLVLLSAAADHPVFLQTGLAVYHGDAALFQQKLYAAHQLGRHFPFALLNLAEAERTGIPENLPVYQRADLFHRIGLVHQVFGGNAAHIQTGAAQMLLLKQGYLLSLFSRGDG